MLNNLVKVFIFLSFTLLYSCPQGGARRLGKGSTIDGSNLNAPTATATATATFCPLWPCTGSGPSATPTGTATPTPTATNTWNNLTPTYTPSPSPSPTKTPSPTTTPTNTKTPTPTPTYTPDCSFPSSPQFSTSPLNSACYNKIGSTNVRGISVVGNKIYAATMHGLSISTIDNLNYQTKTTLHGLGSNSTFDVFALDSNTIYVGTSDGLSISVDGGQTFNNKLISISNPQSNIVYSNYAIKMPNGVTRIFAATENGLYISDDNGTTFTLKSLGFPASYLKTNYVRGHSNTIVTISSPTEGIAVSTNRGDSFSRKYKPNISSLPSNEIRGIYYDIDGSLFLATSKGVAFSQDGFGNSFTTKLSNIDIRSIHGKGSTIVVGCASQGYYYSNNSGSTYNIADFAANGLPINSIFINDTYRAFLGFSDGLYVSTDNQYNDFDNYITNYNLPSRINKVVSFGQKLVVGTEKGLAYTSDGIKYTLLTTGILNNYINDLYVRNNKLYVATNFGIVILNSSLAVIGGPYLSNKVINNVAVSPNDRIFATSTTTQDNGDGGTYELPILYFTSPGQFNFNLGIDIYELRNETQYCCNQYNEYYNVYDAGAITDLEVDANNKLYLSSTFGLFTSTNYSNFSSTNIIESINDVLITQSGHVYAAGSKIWVSQNGNNYSSLYTSTIPINEIFVRESNESKIYGTTTNGLIYSSNSGSSFNNFSNSQGLPSRRTTSIVFHDYLQKVFVGTEAGIGIGNP